MARPIRGVGFGGRRESVAKALQLFRIELTDVVGLTRSGFVEDRTCPRFVPNQRGFKEDRGFIHESYGRRAGK
jgi:hypothetical protein